MVGRYFEVDSNTIGEIKEVIDFDTIKIKPYKKGAKEFTIRIETYDSVHRTFKSKPYEYLAL